jgi:hypothetical protein
LVILNESSSDNNGDNDHQLSEKKEQKLDAPHLNHYFVLFGLSADEQAGLIILQWRSHYCIKKGG